MFVNMFFEIIIRNLFTHKKTSTNPVGLAPVRIQIIHIQITLQLYEEYPPLIAQTLLVMNC